MPRKPRVFSPTGIYHIVLSSVNHHIIFEEYSDYRKMLFIISDCKDKYDIEIYAYCLMDNHVHLLMRATPDALPAYFKSLGIRFAHWYNKKYERKGHLFQGRYFSKPVENESYFLATLNYIHNNPVKAMICKHPSEYKWSSFNAYFGDEDELVNTEFACDIAGTKDLLQNYMNATDENGNDGDFLDIRYETKHFVDDEKALKLLKMVTGAESTAQVARFTKSQRNECILILRDYNLTIEQIARIMDVSKSTVIRVCRMR